MLPDSPKIGIGAEWADRVRLPSNWSKVLPKRERRRERANACTPIGCAVIAPFILT